MKRPDEVTEYLRCGGMNCDNTCSTQLDRLGVEDCLTWRVHGYVQQLEERVIHLEALNQQNLSVITMQERTRARLEEQISQLESRIPRWISVEERLPEHRAFVLMHIPGCELREGIYLGPTGFEYYDKAEKPWAWKNVDELVTHWMQLPQPPKEES